MFGGRGFGGGPGGPGGPRGLGGPHGPGFGPGGPHGPSGPGGPGFGPGGPGGPGFGPGGIPVGAFGPGGYAERTGAPSVEDESQYDWRHPYGKWYHVVGHYLRELKLAIIGPPVAPPKAKKGKRTKGGQSKRKQAPD